MSSRLDFQHTVPLAPLTTFGIGGPADVLITVHSADELAEAVAWTKREGLPGFILGLGANILIGDKGFRGVVIKNEARGVEIDGTSVVAESGAVINDLIEQTATLGLSGLEHYQNIPSTVGGAMWQNLHFLSYPHERTFYIAEIVESASVLTQDGVKEVGHDFFEFGYDVSSLHRTGDVVLSVTFRLQEAPIEEIAVRRQKNAAWRKEKHPEGAERCSAGSIFQKIEGVGAGRLIDAAGLKGHRSGGAVVSEKHANYILNAGGATAHDVRTLIEEIQRRVEAESGYRLKPEISFIGEF